MQFKIPIMLIILFNQGNGGGLVILSIFYEWINLTNKVIVTASRLDSIELLSMTHLFVIDFGILFDF